MSRNPYQPPESRVDTPAAKLEPGPIGIIVVVLTALQVIWSGVYAASSLEMVRVGELSAFSFLLIFASIVALAAGAVLLVLSRRASRYVAGLALALSVLLLLGSRSILFVAQTGIAIGLMAFCLIHFRVMRDPPSGE